MVNKKVLLRECKRHTTRRVVSTPSVVLTGSPPSPAGYPPPARSGWGTLGVCPMEFWVMLQALWDMGTPPGVCPMAFWVMNVAKHYGIWLPPCPPPCRQTEGQTRVKLRTRAVIK